MGMRQSSKFGVAATVLCCLIVPASRGETAPPQYDVLIAHGTIYDGSGSAPLAGDVAIKGDRIVYVGPHADDTAKHTIDARGKA